MYNDWGTQAGLVGGCDQSHCILGQIREHFDGVLTKHVKAQSHIAAHC